jgi:hypothetical protein
MELRKRSRLIPVWLHSLVFASMLLLGAETAGAQIRTVIVSPVPGDPVASGTALRNALAGISSPSATNRWLLKIEPGTYDVGGTPLEMRPYVDIEGSGIEATTIRGNVEADAPDLDYQAIIFGADNTELRFLTVQATGPTSTSSVVAMANYSASPRLYRVKFVAQAQVLVWGLRNVNAAPLIEECEISVTATATGGNAAHGLVFRGYPPTSRRSSILRSKVAVWGATQNYGVFMADAPSLNSIRDSRFDVTGGSTTQGLYADGFGWYGTEALMIRDTEVYSTGGSTASYGLRFKDGATIPLNIFGSLIWGSSAPTTYGIYTENPFAGGGIQGSTITGFTKAVQFGGSIAISSTHLQGGPTTAGGWLGCMGVWDENAVFYTQGCPQ